MPTITDIAGAFTNVVAGQTATLDLPINWIYQSINFEYAENAVLANQATMEASITGVRVKLGGKVIRNFTSAQLNAIHAGYGQVFVDGQMTLFFAEIWRALPTSEIATAWFLQGVADSFQVEVDILAGVVNPTLTAFAEYGDSQVYAKSVQARVVPRNFVKHFTTRQILGAIGTVTENDLGLPGFYHRLHFFETTNGQISEITVKAGKQVAYRKPRSLMNLGITRRGGSLPANLFTVAFDDTLRLGDVMPTVILDANGNIRNRIPVSIEIESTAATNLTMLAEVFAPV